MKKVIRRTQNIRYGWSNVALLYDNNWSLRSLRELLHMVGTQVGW